MLFVRHTPSPSVLLPRQQLPPSAATFPSHQEFDVHVAHASQLLLHAAFLRHAVFRPLRFTPDVMATTQGTIDQIPSIPSFISSNTCLHHFCLLFIIRHAATVHAVAARATPDLPLTFIASSSLPPPSFSLLFFVVISLPSST